MTILIPINQGISYRYIFQTDIFKKLQKEAKKIIILAPDKNDQFYSDIIFYDNVIIEDYKEIEYEEYMNSSKLHLNLKRIRNFVQNSKFDISTTLGHHKIYKNDFNSYSHTIISRLNFWISNFIIFFARRIKVIRKFILFIENKLFSPDIHQDIFDKYKPDLLLVTSLGTFDYDQFFMRQAKKNDVKVVSVILSWDNTTTRGYPAAYSDLIIAWTDIMRKELIQLNDIDEKRIEVGGVALYDYYYKKNNDLFTKDELFNHLKIDKSKDLIFFATKSPNCYVSNNYITKILLKAILKNKFKKEYHILVRMHPIFYRKNNGKLVFSNYIQEFDKMKKEDKNLTINTPQMSMNSLNYSMPNDEIKLLASILKHSSLMINIFSSLNIEASIFDIPIVNIAFEGKIPKSINKARLDINHDLNESHNKRIIESKGIAMVYKENQLIKIINDELENPSKRQNQRKNIRTNEAGPFNGKAGGKIAQLILNYNY